MATTAMTMRLSIECPVCRGSIPIRLVSDRERLDCLALTVDLDTLAEEVTERHRPCGLITDFPATKDESEPDSSQPYFLDVLRRAAEGVS